MPIAIGNVDITATTVYTSSGNTAITFLSLCNYSAGNIVANVYVVPNASTSANLNTVLKSIEIAIGDTYQLYAGGEKLLLSNGDRVQVDANAANSLNAVTSYTQV